MVGRTEWTWGLGIVWSGLSCLISGLINVGHIHGDETGSCSQGFCI